MGAYVRQMGLPTQSDSQAWEREQGTPNKIKIRFHTPVRHVLFQSCAVAALEIKQKLEAISSCFPI